MAYREFCKARYGRVINVPMYPDAAGEGRARERCRKLWVERFKDEPFDVMAGLKGVNSAFAPEPCLLPPEVADIVAVMSRQSSFYYQVDPP